MDIINALSDLNVQEYVLDQIPSSEAEFFQYFHVVTGEDESGTAILSSDPADFPVTWAELVAKRDALELAEPMRQLRLERDKLLAATDWWVLPDLSPTDEQLAYRQALRDITQTYTSLDDVVWPTKPE
jgi:hypothetical protein